MSSTVPSLPISSQEIVKKEILALEYEQMVCLTAIMLHGYEVSVYDLYLTVRHLGRKYTLSHIERWAALLLETNLTYTTWRTIGVAEDARVAAVFAADYLRQEDLEVLLKRVHDMKGYPSGASSYTRYGRSYQDIAIRCMHKLLENKPTEFFTLFKNLQENTPYLRHERSVAEELITNILSTLDQAFWATRSPQFQDFGWLQQQYSFVNWDNLTPRRLERVFTERYASGGALPESSRNILLLGFHHFCHRQELFAEDDSLLLIARLSAGETDIELSPDSLFEEVAKGEPAGFATVVRTAFHYGRGDIDLKQLTDITHRLKLSNLPVTINCFFAFQLLENGDIAEGERLLERQLTERLHPLSWLAALWCAGWMGYKLREGQLLTLGTQLADEEFAATPWVEGELLSALHRASETIFVSLPDEYLARTQEQSSNLYGVIPERPTWAYALRQLQKITGAAPGEGLEPAYRTIWIVDFDEEDVYCKLQKQGKRGWSKGRKLRWTELLRPPEGIQLEEADTRAIAGLHLYDGKPISAAMHYSEEMLYPSFARVLYEIADHPRIYLGEKRRTPLDIIRAEPELQITESPDGIMLRFDPPVERQGYVYRKLTPTRYKVYHLTEEEAEMAFSIGTGVEFPANQREELEQIIEAIRPRVSVQSTFDLIDEDLESLPGSSLPCFHLLPFVDGYKVELYAKSLPEEAFYFKPGVGLPRSVVVLESGRAILERPLQEETAAARAALAACPTLQQQTHENYEWVVEDTQTALRILLELRTLSLQGQVTIEHPKGEKLRITALVGQEELSLRVAKSRDWFEVDGKLIVDEQQVASLARLFEHLKAQRDNPFIQLGEGEFLAITDELRDKVMEMEGLLHTRGKRLELPPLAAGAFAEIADELDDVAYDSAWQSAIERITNAEKLRPRPPKHFNAELRDYQKEGYRWMMRLAEWGVGGCLADDMGLGKTVQALALLTARSTTGPSLVIAPASVTRNWLRETQRFAPALLPVLIASNTQAKLLPELGKGDLALVSYGLLPFISDALEEIDWANIVIDEAQAIKNPATKRAKTVQNLKADFKLATTGTPIENHLGELWSLFRFLNPGLLGSKAAFNEKYNRPIAQNNDEVRRQALRNIVKPFILRRRKDEVLTELPPKTEIVLSVQLSEPEQTLYEAMRRNALKEIAEADEQQRRFTVLAQLTKLRQAACHPRLVRPNSKLASAKLQLVGETLLEILEGGHKALIFSQFVKHLKIVENWVKEQDIAYQYLDGSTPGKKRDEAVNAFQNGEGQVFLISLKAGGTGLNLTRADYVLHLDPWWNPAAEDQASDRAHRIGQQRPVTVYRFVSQGTIEEQIIALHQEKRDLADQILSGTGSAGALGVDEILSLITAPE